MRRIKKKYIYIYNTNTGGYRKENKQEKGQVRQGKKGDVVYREKKAKQESGKRNISSTIKFKKSHDCRFKRLVLTPNIYNRITFTHSYLLGTFMIYLFTF